MMVEVKTCLQGAADDLRGQLPCWSSCLARQLSPFSSHYAKSLL